MEISTAGMPNIPLANLSLPNLGARIVRIEMGRFEAIRPRVAGSNARLGEHGIHVRPPVVRLTTDDGSHGWGLAFVGAEQAHALLGKTVGAAFTGDVVGVQPAFRSLEFPLWDLIAKSANLPVYALLSPAHSPEPLQVRCYDTTLYFDDLHLTDTAEAAALIAQEARDGLGRGHRAFKIKVGRGARHLPLEEGTRRDIAVIRAVREAVGPDAPIMIDANNGWNLNLTKHVLDETADCGIYWVEEAFHEDPVLYRDLKQWLTARNLPIKIADGEGEASPSLVAWAKDGLVDVLQYDIFSYGISRWLALGASVAGTSIGCGPHHYGAMLGNYVTGHLARALPNFQYVEWDEATTPGISAPGYVVHDGRVTVPDTPGFGLVLDETHFQEAVRANGFVIQR